jgi:hypothetical protein
MIRLTCPQCERKLVVKPEFAGRQAICPRCKAVMRVPEASAADDEPIEDFEQVEDPDGAKPRSQQITGNPPRPKRDDDSREEHDETSEDRPRKRRRRRKKKKKGDTLAALNFLGLDTITLIALGVCLVGFLFIPASFVFPPLIWIPLLISTVVSLVGYFWVVMIAYQDDTTQGMLCFCFAPHMLYYIFVNFEDTKQAGIIWIAGTVLQIAASVVAGAMAQQ